MYVVVLCVFVLCLVGFNVVVLVGVCCFFGCDCLCGLCCCVFAVVWVCDSVVCFVRCLFVGCFGLSLLCRSCFLVLCFAL